VAFVGLGLFINGWFMLLSPKAWFRLPSWFAGRGSLKEKRYGSGPASIQVRIAGAVFIAVPVWVACDLMFR
jgi:hypothetical protein